MKRDLIVSKIIFAAPKALPFGVGHYVCPVHLGLPTSLPSHTFDQDIDVQNVVIIFSIPNRPLTFIIILFLKECFKS